MNDFAYTKAGQKLLEGDLPNLVDGLHKLAENVGRLADGKSDPLKILVLECGNDVEVRGDMGKVKVEVEATCVRVMMVGKGGETEEIIVKSDDGSRLTVCRVPRA